MRNGNPGVHMNLGADDPEGWAGGEPNGQRVGTSATNTTLPQGERTDCTFGGVWRILLLDESIRPSQVGFGRKAQGWSLNDDFSSKKSAASLRKRWRWGHGQPRRRHAKLERGGGCGWSRRHLPCPPPPWSATPPPPESRSEVRKIWFAWKKLLVGSPHHKSPPVASGPDWAEPRAKKMETEKRLEHCQNCIFFESKFAHLP